MAANLPNVYGIDESKKIAIIAGTVLDSTLNIDHDNDDKIEGLEIFNSIQKTAMAVMQNVPNRSEFAKERKDYTAEEIDQLANTAAQYTGNTSPKFRFLFKSALRLVLGAYDFIVDASRPEEDFVDEVQA